MAVRILGIDPGLIHTGFGVIDVEGPHVRFVETGVINVPKGELSERLAFIFKAVDEIARKARPDFASCEKVFVNMNGGSTLLLGQARGAAITALAVNGLAVREFNPTEIKMSVVGAGRATKSQVQEMVGRLLKIDAQLKPDAADALACALTAAQSSRMLEATRKEKFHAGRARSRRATGARTRRAWEHFAGGKA